jgi:hypothetical protein
VTQSVESNGGGWQVVRPSECAIAFGIPVFTNEILQNSDQGFAGQFHTRGRIEEFVKDYELTTAAMKQCEAQVITNLKLESFRELFDRHAVVVLFSHAENGTIEFQDGFVDVDTVAAQIPQSFDGVVDITTCYSRDLFRAIRRDRPNCFPFYAIEKRLDAVPWLFFYKALFEYLKSKELSYQAASRELVHEFFDCVRKELPRMKLPELLELYLDRIGRRDEHLGSGRPVTEEDNRFLTELVASRVGGTDHFIVLALSIIGVSYAVAIFVVFYVRNDALMLKTVFAALLTFTLASIAWLRRCWIDKSVMNILILALRELPPESAAAFVEALYRKGIQGQSRRS